jgi:hypothetical protein
MDNYKIIHFESNPIRIKKITNTLFSPNAKFKNKLHSICDTYVKSTFYLKDNLEMEVYKSEMNKPIILRNCGLNYMKGLRLENIEFVETDCIYPSGKMVSKKAEAYYNMVSIKYVMLDYKKVNHIEYVKLIKHSRLDAYIKGNNVKKYELEVDNDNYKVIINE